MNLEGVCELKSSEAKVRLWIQCERPITVEACIP